MKNGRSRTGEAKRLGGTSLHMFIASQVDYSPGAEGDRLIENQAPKSSLSIGVWREGASEDGSNKKEKVYDDTSLKEVLYSIQLKLDDKIKKCESMYF